MYNAEKDETLRTRYRTECWLERCLHYKRICAPTEVVYLLPLKIAEPIEGAQHIHLSFSGLDQAESFWVKRLVRALGITFTPDFSRRSTHLLCPSATGPKYDKAVEWQKPVVDLKWLAEMANTGAISNVEEYSLWGGKRAGSMSTMEESRVAPENQKEAHKDKGKGRAMDPPPEPCSANDEEHLFVHSGLLLEAPATKHPHFEEPKSIALDLEKTFEFNPVAESTVVKDKPAIPLPDSGHHPKTFHKDSSIRPISTTTGQGDSTSSIQQVQTTINTPTRPVLKPQHLTPAQIRHEMKYLQLPSSQSPEPLSLQHERETGNTKHQHHMDHWAAVQVYGFSNR